MLNIHRLIRHTALAGLCCFVVAAHAQDNKGPQAGDPARWYAEDATAQAQMKTLRKEIGAALQEAQAECKRAPSSERGACLKEARDTYQRDMAQAQHLRAAAHPQ